MLPVEIVFPERECPKPRTEPGDMVDLISPAQLQPEWRPAKYYGWKDALFDDFRTWFADSWNSEASFYGYPRASEFRTMAKEVLVVVAEEYTCPTSLTRLLKVIHPERGMLWVYHDSVHQVRNLGN